MMRHIKENNYIFTEQAYAAYQQIEDSLLDSFWESYEKEMYACTDPIIMYYMIQSWFVDHIDRHHQLPELKLQGVSAQVQQLRYKGDKTRLIEIFHRPSQIFYKGDIYPVEYDLEYAESVFSQYERQVSDSQLFGARWWHMHDLVTTVITTMATTCGGLNK